MRIMICGSSAVDMVFSLPEFPTRAEKYGADSVSVVGGGCAANAAVAVARLGGTAQLLARFGDDAIGALTVDELQREGVDCSLSPLIAGGQSQLSSVLVDAAGERQIVAFRGANMPSQPVWDAADLPAFDAALADTRWPFAAARLLQIAKDRGVPGVLDGESPVPADLLALASHTAFSMQGLRDLTGLDDPFSALDVVYPNSGGWVCVTDGAHGVYVRDSAGQRHFPAFAVSTVDTLGAGDVWHGAFTLLLAERAHCDEAVRFANAVAAIKCTRPGGRRGTPSRAQVKDFLKEQS